MMKCREVAALVHSDVDDDLRVRARFRLRAHLMICTGCRAYAGQLRETVRLVRFGFGRNPRPGDSVPALADLPAPPSTGTKTDRAL